jgi:hypothetical protein
MDIFLPVLLALIVADTLREVYNHLWSIYYSRKYLPGFTD